MSVNLRQSAILATATGAAAACLAAAVPAGPALADEPVTLDLAYTCAFPLMGRQPLAVKISANLPRTLKIGERTPTIEITTVDTVSAYATKGLTTMYAATLEGTADAASQIISPNGKVLALNVPNTIAKTTLPASGAFDVTSEGGAPGVAFDTAGEARITVGDILLTLTPRDKDGAVTGLGTFESECVQDPGQNNVLGVIKVGDGPAGPAKFGVTGSTVLKGGGPATVPLTGGFDATISGSSVTGPLRLDPATANLKALGFLPLTAAMVFTPGDLTGTLAGGALSATGELAVGLTSVNLFGIGIGGGANCKTTAPADLALKAPAFDAAAGGTLTGTYTLPALADCGLFTSLISPLVAGSGNTVTLTMKPAV